MAPRVVASHAASTSVQRVTNTTDHPADSNTAALSGRCAGASITMMTEHTVLAAAAVT